MTVLIYKALLANTPHYQVRDIDVTFSSLDIGQLPCKDIDHMAWQTVLYILRLSWKIYFIYQD